MRSSKGFTMVELMVVLSIICVLACISVPLLLRSKMSANEAAAVSGIKAVLAAQSIFKRTDWDGDGVFNYANRLTDLYQTSGKTIELIPKSLAAARFTGPSSTGLQGYQYLEASGYYVTSAWNFQPRMSISGGRPVIQRYGINAFPEAYMITGSRIYAGDDSGVIWSKEASTDWYFVNKQTWRPVYDAQNFSSTGWGSYE